MTFSNTSFLQKRASKQKSGVISEHWDRSKSLTDLRQSEERHVCEKESPPWGHKHFYLRTLLTMSSVASLTNCWPRRDRDSNTLPITSQPAWSHKQLCMPPLCVVLGKHKWLGSPRPTVLSCLIVAYGQQSSRDYLEDRLAGQTTVTSSPKRTGMLTAKLWLLLSCVSHWVCRQSWSPLLPRTRVKGPEKQTAVVWFQFLQGMKSLFLT